MFVLNRVMCLSQFSGVYRHSVLGASCQ